MNSKEANQQRTITKSRFGDQVDSGRVAPLITTIIPTYRRPAMLRRAIKSVLDQTYPNFKVCVYDNASGDETAEVVAEFAREDTRVQYHCHKENIGAVKNFCYGLNEIDTPYYSILSDDDVLLPLFYETVMADFKKYPDAFFAITGTIRMDIDGTVLGVPILKWQPGFYEPPNGLYEMLSKSHPIWTGVMWRKEVKDKLDITPENIGSDMGFALKAAAQFPYSVTLKEGAIFLKHPASMSGSANQKLQLFWFDIWHLIIQDFKNNDAFESDLKIAVEKVLNNKIKRRLFSTAVYAILNNKFECVNGIIDKYKENADCVRHDKFKIVFLLLILAGSKNIPYFNQMLECLYSIYSAHRSENKELLKPYEKYSKMMA